MPRHSDIAAGLDRLQRTAIEAARRGLQTGAAELTGAMQATTAHGDDTGATRASYVAYEESQGGAFGTALSAASALNPGHTASESVGGGGEDVIAVVATSATDYQRDLETGDLATIGPLFDQYAGKIATAAFDAVKNAL